MVVLKLIARWRPGSEAAQAARLLGPGWPPAGLVSTITSLVGAASKFKRTINELSNTSAATTGKESKLRARKARAAQGTFERIGFVVFIEFSRTDAERLGFKRLTDITKSMTEQVLLSTCEYPTSAKFSSPTPH